MADSDINTNPIDPHNFDPDEYRMSFGDHLEELRKRIIWGLGGVALVACFTFWFGTDIIRWLQLPLAQAQHRLGLPQGTITTDVLTPFAIFMKVSILAAVVLGAPWLVYQLWKFVEAGLYKSERRVVIILAPFSTIMVVLGIMFMYYILLPISVSFLLLFSQNYPESGGEKPSFLDIVDAVSPFTGDDEAATGGADGTGDPGDTTPGDDTPPADTNPGDADLPATDAPPPAQPPGTPGAFDDIPILTKDPPNPRNGQVWILRQKKDKPGNLKVFYDDRARVVANLGQRSLMQPMIDIKQYISFVMFMTLGIVIGFQLPVVMLVGGWTGVIPPTFVRKYRKYALFTSFVLGAFLTPSDPLSMMILALPLYLLYEFGIILISMTYKPRGMFWDDPVPGEQQASDDQ